MAKYLVKRDTSGFYFWTLRSDKNFKTVAMSSESYDSKQNAIDSIIWTQNNATTKTIDDLT